MAQTYTRQSTFADGDTITAALFNDEYNQLVNAFTYSSTSATSTGHRHDGTAGQGGNIPKIGDLDFLNKIEVDSTNNRWGFYVEVSSAAVEQIRIQDGAIVPVTDNDIDLGTSSLEFKDLYLDGTATIDTLTVNEAATIGTTLGVTGATTLSSTLGVTGATTLSSTLGVSGATTLSSTLAVTGTSTLTGNVTASNDLSIGGNLTVTGNATISGNLTFGNADTDSITLTADVASNIIPDADNTYDLGSSTKEWKDIYIDGTAYLDAINFNGTAITATAAELNILDGVTSTAAEINLVDGSSAGTIVNSKAVIYGSAGEVNATTLQVGGTSITATPAELNIVDGDTAATSTTLADADRVVVNDAGTMVQVALTDFETYFESALDTLSNVTTVGALNAGSITSGFGAIDNGSSAITTTGTITYGSLSDGTITITAFVDEDDMSSDSATLVPTQQSVKAYVDSQVTAQDLDFQGDSGGALSIDLDSETLTIAGGTGIDTTGATNTLTVAIDSTVATLTGSQTLTNKTLTTPVISSISNTGTLTLPTSTDTLVGRATTDTLTNKTLTSAVLNTGVSGTAVLDEDDMSSDSATQLATQQSIKAYVDSQVAGADTLAELTDTNITTPADASLLFYDTGTSKWIDNVVSGDITIADTGVAAIGSGVIVNADVNASAAIDVSKTALTAGTGLTLSTNTLSVDASQTQITAVGTIATGTWQGTAIADAYVANDLTISGGTVDNTVIGGTTAAAGTFTTITGSGDLAVNTNTLFVDVSENKVGIGTTSPSEELDINGKAKIGNTKIGSDGSGAAFDMTFETYSGGFFERLRIDSSGNVGIGTTSPANNLHIHTDSGDEGILIKSTGDTSNAIISDANRSSAGAGINGLQGKWNGTAVADMLFLTGSDTTNKDDGVITFRTSSANNITERVRIDSSGNVGVGTTSPSDKLHVYGGSSGASAHSYTQLHVEHSSHAAIQISTPNTSEAGILFADPQDTDIGGLFYYHPSNYMYFRVNGAEEMRLESDGDLHVDGNVVAYSTTVSDERLKDDVQDITGALDTVDALRGVTYTWNAGSREGQRDYGVIAQEVEQIIPEIVHDTTMPLLGDEETVYKTVDYEKLCAVLINAVSELRAEVEALKNGTSV